MEVPRTPPTEADAATLWYLATVITFGSMSAFAALMGDESRKVTPRTIAAYIIAGGAASAGVVLLLAESYGFSWFLLGVSVFSGYKAVDVLALMSHALGAIMKRFLNTSIPPRSVAEGDEGGKKTPPQNPPSKKE